jgi:FlaG/FlaF family flagellin (archaellin)
MNWILSDTPSSQRGTTLVTALIILVVVTLITLATLNTSLLEMRMSANEEMRSTATEVAQSAIDNIIKIDYDARQPATLDQDKQYFKIAGAVGEVHCTPNTSCANQTLTLYSPLDPGSNQSAKVRVTRWGEPVAQRGSACVKAAPFTIESELDQSLLGRGKAQLIQGYQACDYSTNPPPTKPVAATNN